MAPLHPPNLGEVASGFPRLGDEGAKTGCKCVSPVNEADIEKGMGPLGQEQGCASSPCQN